MKLSPYQVSRELWRARYRRRGWRSKMKRCRNVIELRPLTRSSAAAVTERRGLSIPHCPIVTRARRGLALSPATEIRPEAISARCI